MKRTKSIQSTIAFQPGDLVRFRHPFRPEQADSREYQFGIISGLVRGAGDSDEVSLSSLDFQSVEVILRLFDPETKTIYRDEYRAEALFSFSAQELTLMQAVHSDPVSSVYIA